MSRKPLTEMTLDEHTSAVKSGMFWVWYPEATGYYFNDVVSPRYIDATPDTLTHHIEDTEGFDVEEQKHSHYFRYWYGKIDTYRVCDLFEVFDSAISHAVKKLLCLGKRGHKDYKKDLQDVIDTLQRKMEMIEEDEKHKS